MIPLLGPTDPFPPVQQALDDPNGLLAAGGGLGVARLIEAYAHGIFPWFSEGDPVLWWCPDPRMVLEVDALHVSRSLLRRLRKRDYQVTADRAFGEVLEACARPRALRLAGARSLRLADARSGQAGLAGEGGTWLVPAMVRAYERLHQAGAAHSIEVWIEDELAGGLYGVALGRMFFGESMFSRRTDGSKIALAYLAAQLRRWEFPLIDCQMHTSHLASLGARDMPRRQFVAIVERLVRQPGKPGAWALDTDLRETVV